jgi:hypothetical protein
MTAEGKTRIQITIGAEQLEKLNALCAEIGISKSAAVAMALNDWVKKVADERETAR